MRRIALALLCLLVVILLAGCATVNSENSFQSQAPGTAIVTQEAVQTEVPQQPDNGSAADETTEAPTQEPAAPGYNG